VHEVAERVPLDPLARVPEPQPMQSGTNVLAPWGPDPWYYPAVVVRVDGPNAFVVYWEGDSAQVPITLLKPLQYQNGMRVAANYLNQNSYFLGVIVAMAGGAVQVQLDNGQSVWTTWAKCRVPKAPPANMS
jgi:hypothetical protein